MRLRLLLKLAGWLTGSLIVLLMAWVTGSHLAISQLRKPLDQDWQKFVSQYPRRDANNSALKLQEITEQSTVLPFTSIGVQTSLSHRILFRTQENNNAYSQIRSDLNKYFKNQLLINKTNRIDPIPKNLQNFLDKNSKAIQEVRDFILLNELPQWQLEVKHYNNPSLALPSYLNHINLQQILLLDSLSKTQQEKHREALKNLEASWKLNQSSLDDPTLISALVTDIITSHQIDVMRKLDSLPINFNEEIQQFEYQHAYTFKNAIALERFTATSILDLVKNPINVLESVDLEIGSQLKILPSILIDPYIKLSFLDIYSHTKLAYGIATPQIYCQAQESFQLQSHTRWYSPWNVFWYSHVVDPIISQYRKVTRTLLSLELTRKIHTVKAVQARTGRFPNHLDNPQSMICPDVSWIYRVSPEGDATFAFGRDLTWLKLTNPAEQNKSYRTLDYTLSRLSPEKSAALAARARTLPANGAAQQTTVEPVDVVARASLPAQESDIPLRIQELKNPNLIIRWSAADVLGSIGPAAKAAIPELKQLLGDRNSKVGKSASIALSRIGTESVPALTEALQDSNPRTRRYAALALGRIGEPAQPAVPQLILLLQDPDLLIQKEALEALGYIGEASQKAVPSVQEKLKHRDWKIRSSAALALGNIGNPAKLAVNDLIQLLNDQEKVVQQRATLALGNIGLRAVPALVSTIQNPQQPVTTRTNAIYALGEIGISLNWKQNQLRFYAHTPSRSVLQSPEEVLNMAKTTIIPTLLDTLNEPELSEPALEALGEFSFLGVPVVLERLQKADGETIASLVAVLNQMVATLNYQELSSEELQRIQSSLEPVLTRFRKTEAVLNTPQTLAQLLEPIQTAANNAIQEQNSRMLAAASDIGFWSLSTLILASLLLINFRPDLLVKLGQSLISAQKEREKFGTFLPGVQQFFQQTGGLVKVEGHRSLHLLKVPGRLDSLSPLPVLVSLESPTEQEVTELSKLATKMNSQSRKAGILLYQEAPGVLFRMRMAEVRMRDHFLLIPIPLAAIEQAALESGSATGLLAQYVDRYLPGADLFDDRNAIGDTLSFFGRTELLTRLEEELLRKQGVGLFGLRKSGKTSILLQLGFALRSHPVVHIDLQPQGGKPRFVAELFNEIQRQLSLLLKSSTPALMPFPKDQPGVELTTEFLDRIGSVSTALQQAGYQLPILCFLDEIERILPSTLDPVEKVEEFNAFFGALRALSQERQQIGFLIADVHPDCNRINQWAQEGVPTNPVFSFFKEIFLFPFDPEETTTMLTDISRLMGREFDSETLTAIQKETGGHPFISRQIASLLCAKIPEQENQGKIEWQAAQRYLNKPFTYSSVLKDYFSQNIWGDLKKRQFDSAMAVLRTLACTEGSEMGLADEVLNRFLQQWFTESQVLDALLWLEQVGLIQRHEVEYQDYYQSRVPLLSRWLRMEMTEQEIQQWQMV